MIPSCVLVLVLLFSSVPAVAAAPKPVPELVFEGGSVVASGLKPGGSVGWATVSRDLRDGVPRLAWNGGVARDEDGDGEVELAAETPRMAVWLAVDLESSAWTMASPPSWQPPSLPEEGRRLEVGASGHLESLSQRAGALIVFLVRPGQTREQGVWEVFAQDGDSSDLRLEPGLVGVGVPAFSPLASSPPGLEELRVGDVMLLVHPRSLASAVAAVGPAGGAPTGQGGR